MVATYFSRIEKTIQQFADIIHSTTTNTRKYNDSQGLISGSITFTDNSKLLFMEFFDLSLVEKVKYKYHYMTLEDELIFRYDNAKHNPEIKTFPHHLHTNNKVLESAEPELFDIMIKVYDKIKDNTQI